MGYELDDIHSAMLGAVPDTYQKTVGFPTYDLTRAFALAVQSLSGDVDLAKSKTDVDNLEGDELTRWCRQRKGVSRREATRASGTVMILSGTGTISVGDLFESGGGVQFRATEGKAVSSGDTVSVEAVEPGAAGSVAAGTVTMMPVTLQGIVSVTNEAPMTGGYDAESDDSLRARYYAAVLAPVASANKAAYQQWALEVSGVGAAQVFPLANGDNTVEVCVIDDRHQPADDALVAKVQEHIDPGGLGLGKGSAPIGAYCTVTTASGISVNAACQATLVSGYDAAAVLANVTEAIRAYLATLPFDGTAYVSYAKIANAVNDAEGVLDYTGLTVNGGTVNIPIAEKEVAVVGAVSIA